MGVKAALDVLNHMVKSGRLSSYAVGGAMAAFRYIEASWTEDLDVLISLKTNGPLVTLKPILDELAALGYDKFHKEGIIVADFPVQFLPVSNALDAEALEQAVTVDVEFDEGPVKFRVFRAEHVIAKALEVGRPKDFSRIVQFAEERAFDTEVLKEVLDRHDLRDKWSGFCDRFQIADPLIEEPRV